MSRESKSLVKEEQITGLKQDELYKRRITDVSRRFNSCQIKAAIKVNDKMLRFYWALGRDISHMSQQYGYGSGFYKQISADLSSMLPDVKSFSATNLKYLRYFYELYSTEWNRQQLAEDSTSSNRQQLVDDSQDANVLVAVNARVDQAIFLIPWGHNILILDKCKGNRDKALFYVHNKCRRVSRQAPTMDNIIIMTGNVLG